MLAQEAYRANQGLGKRMRPDGGHAAVQERLLVSPPSPEHVHLPYIVHIYQPRYTCMSYAHLLMRVWGGISCLLSQYLTFQFLTFVTSDA